MISLRCTCLLCTETLKANVKNRVHDDAMRRTKSLNAFRELRMGNKDFNTLGFLNTQYLFLFI